jgi:hypothetical protein
LCIPALPAELVPQEFSMSKIFYTLDEAAAKLKKSPENVKQMVSEGKLQEFRDRDRLMFKVDQVNLLASGGDDDLIPLADSGDLGTITLSSDSGSGMQLESPKEQTGISIFDADQTEEADPSAVTQITESAHSELSLETVGSGSGLLDLTREADDTSLGQDLLEEVTSPAGVAETTYEQTESVALFESTGAESDVSVVAVSGATMAVAVEPYDGTWSGIAGGMALGMVLLLAFTLALTIFGLSQQPGMPLINMVGENLMMWVGIGAGAILLLGIIGLVVGKKS